MKTQKIGITLTWIPGIKVYESENWTIFQELLFDDDFSGRIE